MPDMWFTCTERWCFADMHAKPCAKSHSKILAVFFSGSWKIKKYITNQCYICNANNSIHFVFNRCIVRVGDCTFQYTSVTLWPLHCDLSTLNVTEVHASTVDTQGKVMRSIHLQGCKCAGTVWCYVPDDNPGPTLAWLSLFQVGYHVLSSMLVVVPHGRVQLQFRILDSLCFEVFLPNHVQEQSKTLVFTFPQRCFFYLNTLTAHEQTI